MTFYAVYVSNTGALQSVGDTLANPLPPGLAAVTLAAPPDVTKVEWDAPSRSFVPLAADGPLLTRYQFLGLFTDAELEAIIAAAATQAAISLYLEKLKLVESVNLSDPATIAGVNGLAAAGLITGARAATILANP